MADWRDNRVTLSGRGSLICVAAGTISSNSVMAWVNGQLTQVRVVSGLSGVNTGTYLIVARCGSSWYALGVTNAPPGGGGSTSGNPPDTGDTPPPTKPVMYTGTTVCAPVSTASWRDGKWRTDIGPVDSADTYQGKYWGSSFGVQEGYAFYGSKPSSVNGATCVRATLRLRRLQSGVWAPKIGTLHLCTEKTRPAGHPTMNEAGATPALACMGKGTPYEAVFDLPVSWGQALINGTRGSLAVGIMGTSWDPYMQFAGRGSYSAGWSLTLYWKRGG